MVRIGSVHVDELSPATRWSSMTTPLSSEAHLLWREEMMDDEIVDICTGLFLVGGVANGPEWM